MALSKRITLRNGVALNYHRVVSVGTITNVQTSVEVASYTSKAKRAEERTALGDGKQMDVYVHTAYHVLPYDKAMDVDAAYVWLKTLPEYEGATDVLEDDCGEVGVGV